MPPILFRATTALTFVGAIYLTSVPSAHAATYTICLGLPVTLDDELGPSYPNEIGDSAYPWKARGIYVESLRFIQTGAYASGFPKYADGNGCFTASLSHIYPFEFQVVVRSKGDVGENNILAVTNSTGQTSAYGLNFWMNPGGGTYYENWDWESHLLRTYAILAYAMNDGFQSSSFDDEEVRIWWYPDGTPNGNTFCNEAYPAIDIVGGIGHICIDESASKRKFLLGHEYGHINLYLSIASAALPNDCSRNDTGHQFHGNGRVELMRCHGGMGELCVG